MKILVTGGTGFVGSSLIPYLSQQGHEVVLLTRGENRQDLVSQISYPKGEELLDAKTLSTFQAIINMAGASISSLRWNQKGKEQILKSRIFVTKLLVDSIQYNKEHGISYPNIFISTSAVGYYGISDTQVFDEKSRNGTGFLANVARQWEEEAQRVKTMQVRCVILRFGIVLGKKGILEQIKKTFDMGVGGYAGSGKQWISWISLKDLVRIISFALLNEQVGGTYNACAPSATQMKELTFELGKALHKKSWTKMPGFILKLVLGQMADELILHGQNVIPSRLRQEGFVWEYADIGQTIKEIFE